MDFNSILIGSEDPQRLVDYYTKVIGEPTFSGEGEFAGWQIGSRNPGAKTCPTTTRTNGMLASA